MSTTFTTRFLVQLRTDLRLLAWPALFTALVIALQLHYRVPPELLTSASGRLYLLAGAPLSWLARLLPFALVLLALRADAPSNSNTASLTRPIGGGAMWCAKLTALVLTLSVPWTVCDLLVASVSPHSTSGWLAIIVSSLGNTLFMIGICAAIASQTSSRRQLMLLAVVLLALWIFGSSWVMKLASDTFMPQQVPPTLKSCALLAAGGVGFLTAFFAWWLATVPRRQRLSLSVLVAGAALSGIVSQVWPIDWLARPALKVERKLALQFGKLEASDKAAAQPLWPTLRVAGLDKDEVCSILALAPIIQDKPWPGENFCTDFQPKDSNPHRLQWVDNEHVRALMHHYAATDLWPLAESYHDPKRPELARLITDTVHPWRLRLAIHRMKQIADLPLAKVWHETCDLPIREGLALRLGPESGHGAAILSCGLHEMRSLLLPEQDHAPLRLIKPSRIYGQNVPFNFALVAHDPEARENTFDFADMAPYWGGRDSSWGLLVDRTNYRGTVNLPQPKARIALGFTTEEHWLSTTTVQVWIAEEGGTVDLDLSVDQVKQVLATRSTPSPPSRSR